MTSLMQFRGGPLDQVRRERGRSSGKPANYLLEDGLTTVKARIGDLWLGSLGIRGPIRRIASHIPSFYYLASIKFDQDSGDKVSLYCFVKRVELDDGTP